MDGVISVAAVLVIVAYVGLAIWVISKRQTVGSGVGASIGFALGSFVIMPVASMIASIIVWAFVIMFVLILIGSVCG